MKILLLLLPLFLFSVPNPPGRPSKAPFVSGDAFRAYSDYCYDEVDKSLDPLIVPSRSTIFVKTDYLQDFFDTVHPHLPYYILIAHNSDAPTPGRFRAYLDDPKLIAWFGQNYDGYEHPKMHPIPMGIANFCWPHGNADILKEIQEQRLPKQHLAHMNFDKKTFLEERFPVFRQFTAASYCYRPPQKPYRGYMADLAASKFEIAPRGNAWDTHRIWESLYVGTIPIVKSSPLDKLYAGLPILIIQDWHQVNERFLQQKYQEISSQTYNLEKTSMNYWSRLIDSYKYDNR